MKRRLLPCPFCGTVPSRTGSGFGNLPDGRRGRYLVCVKCGAEGPLGDSVKGALDAWNTRSRRVGPKDWMPGREARRPS